MQSSNDSDEADEGAFSVGELLSLVGSKEGVRGLLQTLKCISSIFPLASGYRAIGLSGYRAIGYWGIG